MSKPLSISLHPHMDVIVDVQDIINDNLKLRALLKEARNFIYHSDLWEDNLAAIREFLPRLDEALSENTKE